MRTVLRKNLKNSAAVSCSHLAMWYVSCARGVTDVKVDAAKVGQALYPLVMAEKDAGSREGGLPIGARALSAFRELYRFTWDEPRVRGQESNIERQIR